MLTTYSVGWPASSGVFDITLWDYELGVEKTLEEEFREHRYTVATRDNAPALLIVYPRRPTGRGTPFTFPLNDPPSLSSLRWQVRSGLNDVDDDPDLDFLYPESPKWSDRELNGHLREGIAELSNYMPNEVMIETSRSLLRPDVFRRITDVLGVRYYESQLNEWVSLTRFSRRTARGPQQSWDWANNALVLHGRYPDDAKLEVHVSIPFVVPQNDLAALDIERDDWDIVSIYAQGRAYLRLAGQSAQLDRWKEEGKRNDNPITPIGRMLLEDASNRMRDRRGPRAIRRYRG